ncbi:MAG: Ig-like domain-containing protein, partial [Pseudomonadota bacterium]
MADDRDDLPNENENQNQTGSATEAQQALDDLTVLTNVGDTDMGAARLNISRPVEVDDAKLGSLATVHQGSDSAPEVKDGATITTGQIATDEIAIDQVGEIQNVGEVGTIELAASEDNTYVAPTVDAEARVSRQDDLSTTNIVFGDPLVTAAEDIETPPPAPEEEVVVEEVAAEAEAPAAEQEILPEQTAPEFAGIIMDDPFTDAFDPRLFTDFPEPIKEDQFPDGIVMDFQASDTDGDVLVYSLSQPSHGIIESLGGGSYRFTPEPDWHGTDSFTVTVRDDDGNVATKTFSINIEAVADAPVVISEVAAAGVEDHQIPLDLKFDLAQLETLDSVTFTVPDGAVIMVDGVAVAPNDDGTVTLSGDQLRDIATVDPATNIVTLDGVTVLPPAEFDGTFGVDVAATSRDENADGTFDTATSTFTINVTAAEEGDEAPELGGDGAPITVTVGQDGSVTGDVDAVDPDGDTLTYGLIDPITGDIVPSVETPYGTITIDQATGEFQFTASETARELDDGESIAEQFQVVATDGEHVSEPGTINVTISGSNDEPVVAVSGGLEATEGGAAVSGTATATDVDDGYGATENLSFAL